MLPVAALGAQLIRNYRSLATGSYEVGVKVVPATGSYYLGDSINVQVKINRISARAIKVSGVQAVITVGDKLQINNVSCLAPFNGLPFININGQQVTIFCAIATSTTPVTLSTGDVAIATLSLTVDPYATDGTTQITFNSTRVTEAGIPGQAPDVSNAGSLATYTIIATPPCPRGDVGNLDCSVDGCIDTVDFELFRQSFGQDAGSLYIPDGQATPDMVVDAFNVVDTADYEILRGNFGTCQ